MRWRVDNSTRSWCARARSVPASSWRSAAGSSPLERAITEHHSPRGLGLGNAGGWLPSLAGYYNK